jgi:hypothetical protein
MTSGMMTPDDRFAADVFGLTYREYAAARAEDYRLRLVAPEAIRTLNASRQQRWSPEKLADYLHTDTEEASMRLRRFLMSERVNAGRDTPERLSRLFAEWLSRFDLDERERKELSRDLSRLLSSQLHVAAESGETLEDLIEGLEKSEGGPSAGPSTGSGTGRPGGADEAAPRAWGPQWKD